MMKKNNLKERIYTENTPFFKFLRFLLKYPETYLLPIFLLIFLIELAIATKGFDGAPSAHLYNEYAIGNSVKWYAVFILSGIIFGVILSIAEAKKLNISVSDLTTGILIIVPLSIIGARIYYVIFAPPGADFSTFGKIINIREGGMAIHGAIIVAFISSFIYARVKKMPLLKILDFVVLAFLIGQCVGRWGNFMNHEAHGIQATNKLIGLPDFIRYQMYFSDTSATGINQGSSVLVFWQPTFLYESLLNLLCLLVFLVLRRIKLLKVGDLFGLYLIWYGFVRGLIIEPLRQDPLYITLFGQALKTNVILSIFGLALGGIVFLIIKYKFVKNLEYYYDASQGNTFIYKDFRKENSKFKNTKVVVFDFDGTLYDSADIIYKSYNEVFEKYLTPEQIQKVDQNDLIGLSLEDICQKYNYNNDPEQIKSDFIITLTKYEKQTKQKLYPYVKEILKWLKGKNIKIAIATNNTKVAVLEILQDNHLIKYFDTVYAVEDVVNPKPNKEVLEKIMTELNSDIENTLFVGDSVNDMICSKNSNVKICAVSYSKTIQAVLEKNPDYVVESLEQLKNIIIERG